MRFPNAEWGALNASQTRERRFVYQISFDPNNIAEDIWIPSHSDVTITQPGTVINGRVTEVPGQSQTLFPDDGRSTVGNMSFKLMDVLNVITEELRDRLNVHGQGLRGKRVRFWSGFRDLGFQFFELEATQFANSDLTYNRSLYTFSTYDRMGDLQRDILEPVVLNLAQPIDMDVTTIPVFTTAGLEAKEHGISYTDGSTSGQSYAYVRIDDEIILVEQTGIQPTSLVNVQRGALGTRAAEHTTDETKGQERGKEVSEVIYLELPWPKLLWALLTGNLIGQGGTLPAHWHAGLTGADVDLGSFTGIGADFYDSGNDMLGVPERWVIEKSEDAKRFCEAVAAKYGCFLLIDTEGQIQLKRIASTVDGASVVAQFDKSNIVGIPSLKFRHSKIQNNLLVRWNEINGTPSRSLEVIDSRSQSRHGASTQQTINALGWAGSRLTEQQIKNLIASRLDLYAGVPIETSITVLGSQVLPEIGDLVRVKHGNVEDYTTRTVGPLDRAFLIVGKKTDLRRGRHQYRLLGATSQSNPETPLSSAPIIPDGWYTSQGTNIATLPGVVDTGPELIIPDGHSFDGGATLSDPGSIFYATKNVRFPAGQSVRINGNVQFRLRGNGNTIDGSLGDGAGIGLPGITDSFNTGLLAPQMTNTDQFETLPALQVSLEPGIPGYFGTTQADGGLSERIRRRAGSTTQYAAIIQSLASPVTQGLVEAIPNYLVGWNGVGITGLPDDLRGTSGGPGGLRHWHDTREQVNTNRGGTGGSGGPGVLVVARGLASGLAGTINLSGQDGAPGVRSAADQVPAWSGSGAGGAPGAFIAVIDGATGNTPILTNGNVVANYGETTEPPTNFNRMQDALYRTHRTRFGPDTVDGAQVREDRLSAYESVASGRFAGLAAARYFFVADLTAAPQPDADDTAILGDQVITATVVEAFDEIDDGLVTVFRVTVTRVNVTGAYAGAAIYTRPVGETLWKFQDNAEDIEKFYLPADGRVYDIEIRPVLVNGDTANSGFISTQVQSQGTANAMTLPAQPNSLLAFDRNDGYHLIGQVPYLPATNGRPLTAKIYRSTAIADPVPGLVAQYPVQYDAGPPQRYIFAQILAKQAADAGQTYYYWVEASNEFGDSARFPAGDGILAAP